MMNTNIIVNTYINILVIIIIITIYISTVSSGWIDPATYYVMNIDQQQNITIESYANHHRRYRLVMSDEFNTNGRQFHDGSDPKWTAIHKDDYTNYALHFYNSSLVNTNDGFLNITTIIQDVTFSYDDVKTNNKKPSSKKTKNYQSGMLQGWNKFCFTGGIVEISAKLPGDAFTGGLWPAMWMLGNLARATYVGSSNNIWPWSFDTCRHGSLQHQQRFSACNSLNHYDFHSMQGRGAPEIDILEAMPGKAILERTSTTKPYYSASLQVAPGIEEYRPNAGEVPKHSLWYRDGLTYGHNSSLNIFFYGMHLDGDTKEQSYLADAISANRNIQPTHFQHQHIYRIEWQPGDDGYIQWFLDGALVFHITAQTLALTGAIIPEEPMYLLLNTAISSTWGFPIPCPDGCACDCFDCREVRCACGVPYQMCKNFPAYFLIDYIRVYQDESEKAHKVGCSTPEHPSSRYIEAHSNIFSVDGQKQPLHPISHGGGVCKSDIDCGLGPTRDGQPPHQLDQIASCVQGKCNCLTTKFTGPYCKAPSGHNDIEWEPKDPLVVFNMIVPYSLRVLITVILMIIVLLSAWKYRHERWLRDPQAAVTEKDQSHHYEPIINGDDHNNYNDDNDGHGHDGNVEMGVINENIRLGSKNEYGSL